MQPIIKQLPPVTAANHFEEAARLQERIKPLLDGTLLPRMPYWWSPTEELCTASVGRFVASHLIVWGCLAAMGAWLIAPWVVFVYATLFLIEIGQLIVLQRLPAGTLLEAIQGMCVGAIYAVAVLILGAVVLLFAFEVEISMVWWRGLGLTIVTATTYIGLNAGRGLRQHILRGRASYGGALLRIVQESAVVLVPIALTIGFWEILGELRQWGFVLAIGMAAGILQSGLGEYRYRMAPQELGRVLVVEFGRWGLVVGIFNVMLASVSRWPSAMDLLVLWLVPSTILFEATTTSAAELSYSEWRAKAFSFGFPIRELRSLGKRMPESASRMARSLATYPKYSLRALTWEPIMLTAQPRSN